MGALEETLDCIETPFAPITDRASTFGFNRWTKLVKKTGKKPIYGVELAVSPNRVAKKVTKSYWTFIATGSLAPLHRLVRVATAQFRYEPLLEYAQLKEIAKGLVIIPGRNAILPLIETEELQADNWLRCSAAPSTPATMLDWAREKGVPLVASSDNYYPTPDDREAYEVLTGRGATSQTFPQHILSMAEMEYYCGRDAIDEAFHLADLCQAQMLPATLLSPEKLKTLHEMCVEGADRLGCDLSRPEYSERLKRELDLIKEKNFEDYFYIIADLIQYANNHMLVGPARGSSCGSLACYLLGITTVDPIPFGLIFERFIDITRSDLPDIDIDFSDQRRHLVFKYLENKYGKERVARLGSVALYKPKSAINETAAALKVPKWRTASFTASIIDRSSGDSRALQAIEDTFNDTPVGRQLLEDFPELRLSQRLEGHPRHYSQHAAGVVVTERPVEEYVAIDTRTNSIQCDKKDAEDLNLLKIDALGLTQLSIFEDCLEMAGLPRNYLIRQPLDDLDAFRVLNERRWAGIFQFNGHALQSICQQVKVVEFEDIVSITALARPGPLNSGGTNAWIERKNGREPITYIHPAFEPHLKSSLGIVAYQEQVMSIGREIGKLSWDDVTALRKAMSKSLGKEFFDQYGDRFKEGAKELGLAPERLDKLWDDLCAYGAWAFNRSHSVAYGHISYWCCLLKSRFPLEFAAATLSHLDDSDQQLKTLREMAKEGIDYVPVDAKLSNHKWQAANGKLIGPLTNVKGLGPKMLNEIMEARSQGKPLPKRAQKLLAHPETPIDRLEPLAHRLGELYPNGLEEAGVTSVPRKLVDCQPETSDGRSVVVIAKVAEINPRDVNEVASVQKRGGRRVSGDTAYLNLVLEDDTDRMLARVGRWKFKEVGAPILNEGGAGNSIYVLKGKIADDFRILNVDRAKLLGKMKA